MTYFDKTFWQMTARFLLIIVIGLLCLYILGAVQCYLTGESFFCNLI